MNQLDRFSLCGAVASGESNSRRTGALARFDVVDLAVALAPRPLLLLAPDSPQVGWRGASRPEFNWAQRAYNRLGAASALRRAIHNDPDRLELITQWLCRDRAAMTAEQ